jgi:metal-responsive CopG/Arc/MetJ family transcriptional regulator
MKTFKDTNVRETRKTATFWFDKQLLEKFKKICIERRIVQRSVIVDAMERFVKKYGDDT